MDWIFQAISAVASGIAGYSSKQIKQIILDRRIGRKFYADLTMLHEIGKEVLRNTQMDRWTVFMVHNGGKQLSLLRSNGLSILEEDCRDELPPRKYEFQKHPLDLTFYNFLQQCFLKGSVVGTESDMEIGQLKYALAKAGIVHNQVFFMMENKEGHYFLSYSSSKVTYDKVTFKERALINMNANRIKALFLKA